METCEKCGKENDDRETLVILHGGKVIELKVCNACMQEWIDISHGA